MGMLLFIMGFVMMLQLLQKGDATYSKTILNRKANGHSNYGKFHREHGYRKSCRHPCQSITCLNGGTCITNSEGITSCICANGFVGQDCARNPCQSLTCLYGGTCTTNSEVIASCICAEGFLGQNCEQIKCPTPGYIYISTIDFCIKLYNDGQTWDAARSRCAAENARLVVVDTKLKELLKNYILNQTGDYTEYWIGLKWLSGQDSASIWQWLSGEPLQNTYQNWQPPGPITNNGQTTCAANNWNDVSYSWYTESCDYAFAFATICEQKRI